MKKLFILFGITIASLKLFAQFEVKDTLLLAYEYESYWGSSSELEPSEYSDYGKYGSVNLGDNNPETCWAEGSEGNGAGEYIWMIIPKNTSQLNFRNGFQKSETTFMGNNRVKEITVYLYPLHQPQGYVTETHTGFFIGEPLYSQTVFLDDISGMQELNLDINWNEINSKLIYNEVFEEERFVLKIEITAVYKGNKWDDTCISDIIPALNPVFELSPDEHGFLKVTAEKTDTLFYNPDMVYQVVEMNNTLEWIIFIEMPADIESSRVETTYKLYNTKKEEFVMFENIVAMYGFMEKDSTLYLEGSDKNYGDVAVPLE